MAIESLNDYEEYLTEKGIDPYSEVADIEKSSSEKTRNFTDTNSPEQRIIRLQRQKETEPLLEDLKKQSLVERTTFIREKVFGDGDVRGDPPTRIRQRIVSSGKERNSYLYPNEIKMAEKYFPNLVKFVDSLYDSVSSVANLTHEQALRFSAVVYDIGILVHPYVDGNGQTFRLTAESYLNELSPNTEKLHFPYRNVKDSSTNTRVIHTDMLDRTPISQVEPSFSGIVSAQDFFDKIPTHDERSDDIPDEYSSWLDALEVQFPDIKIAPSMREDELRAHVRQDVIHRYLDHVLVSEDSLNNHLEYILKGTMNEKNASTEISSFNKLVSYTHNRTATQMKNLLQDDSQHEKDYAIAIKALKS